VINALSVDVEEHFQVSAFEGIVNRSDWDRMESRVEANTHRLLDLFTLHGVKSTFFVLGWVAERHPDLVRAIRDSGHEVASHGYDHRQITMMSRDELRRDARKSKEILEGTTGEAVLGYRAPSFSVTRATLWALDTLSEEGFAYDSSIFPIRHDRYGFHDSPRFPWQRTGISNSVLHEFPISTVRLLGQNLPFVGGGYLRQFPFRYVEWGMRRVNQREQRPVVLYVHPWEIDPEQPRVSNGRLTTLRHYRNLDKTEARLGSLLETFAFAPLRDVLGL